MLETNQNRFFEFEMREEISWGDEVIKFEAWLNLLFSMNNRLNQLENGIISSSQTPHENKNNAPTVS